MGASIFRNYVIEDQKGPLDLIRDGKGPAPSRSKTDNETSRPKAKPAEHRDSRKGRSVSRPLSVR